MNKQELAFYLAHKKLKPEQIEELLTNFLNSELAQRRPKIGLLGAWIIEPDQLQNFANDFFKDTPNNVDKSLFAHLGQPTEPEIKPEDMVSGEWYVVKYLDEDIYWIFKYEYHQDNEFWTILTATSTGNCINSLGVLPIDGIKSIRKATKEEVLKYFPDEKF
jgi:hypothetical protein